MNKCLIAGALALLCMSINAEAQFEGFKQWYPIGEEAEVMGKTSYVESETILFEASPIARYSLYNNMLNVLDEATEKQGQAGYIAFKPHIRMYTDPSFPVKTPSYKIELGYQRLFKLEATDHVANFFSVGLESGHYSNGQSGSSFSELYEDGSPQGDSMYTLITDESDLSSMLNRKSGNFSTNITELHFNYRNYRFRNKETHIAAALHSVTFGLVVYNDRFLWALDFGGYSEDDIKIYGRIRYQLGYEYTHVLPNNKAGKNREYPRLSFTEKLELIQGAHPSVNPIRSETRVSYAPGGKTSLGFAVFAGVIYGHDNYNYRFVDSGLQLAAGLSWTPSPLPYIGRAADVIVDQGSDE